jgi:hippurate hydrolase
MLDSESPILEMAEGLLPDVTALRRAIHAEPELGLRNPLTAAKIKAALAGLPLELREGPSTSGIVATLRGGAPGRRILLRGDTDALPMHEDTGLPFASTVDGAMHACGHDSHVAMLAGAARLLCARRDRLRGEVVFMFQPGEEGHHGARFMLDDGLLDPRPDIAFALHVMPTMACGTMLGRAGSLLASADTIEMVVRGRGGHASMPHDALDPVPIACEIVSAIQAWVTRQVPVGDPAVVTIASIHAGTTDNVIPESATLLGTIRTLSPARRQAVRDGLRRLGTGIAQAHGAEAEVTFRDGFPVTVCDGAAVDFGRAVVEDLFGARSWVTLDHPVMGAEDFSYVLEHIPGAMFFLGAGPSQGAAACCGLHSNRMVLDEAVMAHGVALHAALAERYLAQD